MDWWLEVMSVVYVCVSRGGCGGLYLGLVEDRPAGTPAASATASAFSSSSGDIPWYFGGACGVDEIGLLVKRALFGGVVCGFAPYALVVHEYFTVAKYRGVDGQFEEGSGPVCDLLRYSGGGEDVPFPLGVGSSWGSTVLDVVDFDRVDNPG